MMAQPLPVAPTLGVPTINLMDDVGHLAFSHLPKLATTGKLSPSGFRVCVGLFPSRK
jgi:hypothetical protein